MLPILHWEELQGIRREWEDRLRRSLADRLEDEYEPLKNGMWDQAKTLLEALRKLEGPSLESLLHGLGIWFHATFPSLGDLRRDARVSVSIKGIHSLQFLDDQSTRDAVLSQAMAAESIL